MRSITTISACNTGLWFLDFLWARLITPKGKLSTFQQNLNPNCTCAWTVGTFTQVWLGIMNLITLSNSVLIPKRYILWSIPHTFCLYIIILKIHSLLFKSDECHELEIKLWFIGPSDHTLLTFTFFLLLLSQTELAKVYLETDEALNAGRVVGPRPTSNDSFFQMPPRKQREFLQGQTKAFK